MKKDIVCICWFVFSIHCGAVDGNEKKLFQKLFKNYSSFPRPAKAPNVPVVIQFGVALNQILDLDEKMQTLTTSTWITQSWLDEELVWHEDDYDGLNTLIVPSTRLWIPDIFIFNGAGGNHGDFVNVTNGRIMIHNNGNITWLIPLMIKSTCRVDATYFPYDEQTCDIYFGSWIYDEGQLDLQPLSGYPDLSNYIVNSEFELIDVTMKRELAEQTCCPGNGKHPMILVQIQMKRKSIYYDYIVIAPTILLSILSLFSFFLPSHHGDKVTIGLTVFLTLYVLQLLISDNVPDTNTTPLLGVYTFLVMTFNCTSIIIATMVMNIKNRGKRNPVPDIPPFLSKLCRGPLGKITFSKFSSYINKFNLCSEEDAPTIEDLEMFNKHKTELQADDSHETPDGDTMEMSEIWNDQNAFDNDTSFLRKNSRHALLESHPEEEKKQPFLYVNRIHLRNSYRRALMNRKMTLDESSGGPNTYFNGSQHDMDRNFDYTNRMNVFHQNTILRQEWNFCADTLERAAFLLYAFATFVTIITILVILPACN